MDTWIRCKLSPGQFSNELVVIVRSAHGREFSLFAPKTDVEFDEKPTENQPVEGWVRVTAVRREGNLFLVKLPRTTVENGQYITAASGQFRIVPDVVEAQHAR